MNKGMKVWKIIVKINNTKNKREKILRTKVKSYLSSLLSCNFSTKIGTKAELKAPSAKILRKKFGRRKAAKKASEIMLTPINLAINISLIKPKILDNEMTNEIVKTERKICMCAF